MTKISHQRPKQKRIYWDEHDKETIFKNALECAERHPTKSPLSIFKKAQEIAIQKKELSHEKKRNITTLSMVPWFEPRLKEAIKNNKNPEPEIIKINKEISEFSTDELLTEIVKRALSSSIKSIVDGVSREIIGHVANANFKSHTIVPTKRRKKVFIIGLIDSQQSIIKEEFGNDLDLSFIKESVNGDWIKQKANNSDYTIAMTGFISHSQYDSAKSAAGDKFVTLNRGISSLKSELIKIRDSNE